MDLGYWDMWKSFNKQADEEGRDVEKREQMVKEIQEGINEEIEELAALGVLR